MYSNNPFMYISNPFIHYRYIFGEALFIGWAGGVLMIIGGLLALCTSCGYDEEDNSRGYVYRPPKQNRNSQEYV